MLVEGDSWSDSAIPLGINDAGKPVLLSAAQLRSHVVVTGPTGEGKTTTMVRLLDGILVRWAPARLPVITFDFKGDPELVDVLTRMAEATGRRLHVVSVTGRSAGYNPIAHGTAEQVASSLVAMIDAQWGFSEPHHKTEGQRWLLLCMTVLDDLIAEGVLRDGREAWRRTLVDLSAVMRGNGRALVAVMAALSPAVAERARTYLADVAAVRDKSKSLDGMGSRIALLTETSAGTVVGHPHPTVDLREIITRGDIALFSLDSDADKDGAATVGSLAVADLQRTMADLKREAWHQKTGRRVFVPLDEFTGLGGEILGPLFSRMRGAGGTLFVYSQADADFAAVSEQFAEQVWANSNVHILHRQPGGSAADRADEIGTRAGWQETVQVTEDTSPLGEESIGSGVGTLRRVERYVVHPNELRQLQVGQVILTSHTPRVVERVAVTPVTAWEGVSVQDIIDHQPSATLAAAFGAPLPEALDSARTEQFTDQARGVAEADELEDQADHPQEGTATEEDTWAGGPEDGYHWPAPTGQ